MAFNAFEQLEWVVPEPRQAFEDVVAEILISSGRAERRIDSSRGDGGVDVYYGAFAKAEVYQAKYFPKSRWTDSQKQQIRDSYKTALRCPEFNLSSWRLCVPSRLTKEDVRWFDEWAKSNASIAPTLVDGDDLVRYLKEPTSGRAREMLRKWGTVGIESDGAVMDSTLHVEVVTNSKSGLTHVFKILLRNSGGRSADDLRININHSESVCIPWLADESRWLDKNPGTLNPRSLAARESIHPGEDVLAIKVPIVKVTPFPFTIVVKSWVRDSEPREQHLIVEEAADLKMGEARGFSPGPGQGISRVPGVIPGPVLAYPEDSEAEVFLADIAKRKKTDEYGIAELLIENISSLTRTRYFPSLVPRGSDGCEMDTVLFYRILSDLTEMGWIERKPIGQDSAVRLFRLSKPACEDRRFKELVNLGIV